VRASLVRRTERVDEVIRLVEDGWLSHYPGRITGKGWLVFSLGRRAYQVSADKITRVSYEEIRVQQRELPYYVVNLDGLNYWQFQDRVYSDSGGLVAEQLYAVLVDLDTGATVDRIA